MSEAIGTAVAVVDVRLGESLEGVVLSCSNSADLVLVAQHLPAGTWRRAVGGIGVDSRGTQALLGGLPGACLRWSPEALRFAENRRRVNGWADRWRAGFRSLSEGGQTDVRSALADARDLEVLDDHQRANVAAMTLPDSPGLCVFDEQGAGKTVTGI